MSEVDDESSIIQGIGFMFDACHSKITKKIIVSEELSLDLTIIGEDPGHVQSGQYLWPAALFAAKHLANNWSTLNSANVLELGAGCGLTGIVASHMPNVRSVILTDYDPGCLTILSENLENNKPVNSTTTCKVCQYEWGRPSVTISADIFGLILELLGRSNGIFMLVSSFDVGENIDLEVNLVCRSMGLTIEEIIPLNIALGNCRVQYFRVVD